MGERLAIREEWPPELQSLMHECWAVVLSERPAFEDIYKRLETALLRHHEEVSAGNTASPVTSVCPTTTTLASSSSALSSTPTTDSEKRQRPPSP